MTGPEHYREAQRIADIASRSDPEISYAMFAEAAVHASLALTAALVGVDDREHWRAVIV